MVWLNYGLEGAIHLPTLYDAVFVDAILMRLRVGSCVERVKRRDTGEIMYEEERERERVAGRCYDDPVGSDQMTQCLLSARPKPYSHCRDFSSCSWHL